MARPRSRLGRPRSKQEDWRDKPITDAQRDKMIRLKIDDEHDLDELTRGEASDLIDLAMDEEEDVPDTLDVWNDNNFGGSY